MHHRASNTSTPRYLQGLNAFGDEVGSGRLRANNDAFRCSIIDHGILFPRIHHEKGTVLIMLWQMGNSLTNTMLVEVERTSRVETHEE